MRVGSFRWVLPVAVLAYLVSAEAGAGAQTAPAAAAPAGDATVAIRSGRDRRTQLTAAVGRKDAELANHEFTILTVLRQRSEQLVAEANQCIGEEAAFVGDTRTKVTIDPSIPPDETPYPSNDPSLVLSPPPCTSCTL